jgi:23S rRNA pseudouridine1911/1915/1917 synthase
MGLDIVFEDADILVISKPVGIVTHPAAGHLDGTLLNGLLFHCEALQHIPRAGIVHRLDKGTSGLMVVAKTLKSQNSLVDQLQKREITRQYQAIVYGEVTGGGSIDQPIGRHPSHRTKMAVREDGKPARTHYHVLRRFSGHTHLSIKLESGRTHQIRVHMSFIRFPLVGDPLYGGTFRLPRSGTARLQEELRNFERPALHACALELKHPATGELMRWEKQVPLDMVRLLDLLADNE